MINSPPWSQRLRPQLRQALRFHLRPLRGLPRCARGAGCGGGRIGRTIFQHDWAVLAFQEPQRFRQDSALEVRFVRRSEGAAEFERNPEKTGELHLFRVFTDQAYSGGRDAFGFEVVTCRANGAGAVRSDGDEADRVDLVLPKQTREFTHGGLDLLG